MKELIVSNGSSIGYWHDTLGILEVGIRRKDSTEYLLACLISCTLVK